MGRGCLSGYMISSYSSTFPPWLAEEQRRIKRVSKVCLSMFAEDYTIIRQEPVSENLKADCDPRDQSDPGLRLRSNVIIAYNDCDYGFL